MNEHRAKHERAASRARTSTKLKGNAHVAGCRRNPELISPLPMHFIPHGRPVRSWRRILRNRMPKIRPLPANELFKAIQFFLSCLPATAEQPFLQLLSRTSARREVIAEIQFHIPQKQQAIFPAKASDMLFKSSDHLLLPFHEKFAHTGVHSHRLHVTFRFGHLIHQHLPRKNRL